MDTKTFYDLIAKVEKARFELQNFVNAHPGNYTATELTQYKHLKGIYEAATLALGNYAFANADLLKKMAAYKDLVDAK